MGNYYLHGKLVFTVGVVAGQCVTVAPIFRKLSFTWEIINYMGNYCLYGKLVLTVGVVAGQCVTVVPIRRKLLLTWEHIICSRCCCGAMCNRRTYT
jgi:hypothetical protein